MKIFIGGSRRITQLSAELKTRIDSIVAAGADILVGDANGVDKAIQQYLFSKRYSNVEVFCSEGQCRNNVGSWPLRSVTAKGKTKNFDFYAAKDRAMAREASAGLMIWDGKSVGTLANVLRLLKLGKTVVVYEAPASSFSELAGAADWDGFVSGRGPDLRTRVEQEAAREIDQKQPGLF